MSRPPGTWTRTQLRGVPTWNYAVAHLHGRCNQVSDEDALGSLIARMSAHFEQRVGSDWQFEMERDSHRRQLRGLVGFRFVPPHRAHLQAEPEPPGRQSTQCRPVPDAASRPRRARHRGIDAGGAGRRYDALRRPYSYLERLVTKRLGRVGHTAADACIGPRTGHCRCPHFARNCLRDAHGMSSSLPVRSCSSIRFSH